MVHIVTDLYDWFVSSHYSHRVYKVYVETKEHVELLHKIDADSNTKVNYSGIPTPFASIFLCFLA